MKTRRDFNFEILCAPFKKLGTIVTPYFPLASNSEPPESRVAGIASGRLMRWVRKVCGDVYTCLGLP